MLLNLKTEILSEDFHPSIRNLRLMLTASVRKPKGKCSSPAIQKLVITMLLNLKTEILSEDFHPSIRNLRLMLSVIKVIQRHLEKLADKEKK